MRRHTRQLVALLASLSVATAVGAGFAASQSDGYAVEQGSDCYELAPVTNETQPVEAFYGYTTDPGDEGERYSANTPMGIEHRNDGTSSLFLYEGPDGLSLVVLHGGINDTRGGGAATVTFDGLPADGEWVVRDDPANLSVESWNRTTAEGRAVDWGWRERWTDGGAFRGGLDGEFRIRIDASFGEAADIEPLEPGNVTAWRALSAENGSLESHELDRNQSITLRSGGCG